jgi:serine phosphatase RsbU (regulator of sigma subunit)
MDEPTNQTIPGSSPPDPADELRNFEAIAQKINPSDSTVPRLAGADIWGEVIPLRGAIGGDHVLYVDFDRRYDLDARIVEAESAGQAEIAEKLRKSKQRAGVLIADVSGHRVTDAVIAAMLHQSFLLGVLYELEFSGEVTTRLFEHLNTRFFKTSSVNKLITMLYGEVSGRGRFRFISAAHPPPVVFSREYQKLMPIGADRIVVFPPIGMLPSEENPDNAKEIGIYGYKRHYTVNEINLLSPGDALLLYTDGLSEHADGNFFPGEVERCFRETGDGTAKEICSHLRQRVMTFGAPVDDVSFIVIRRR